MAITVTTLFSGVGVSDTLIGLTSTAGVTAPVRTTGVGFTCLYCGTEMMGVNIAPRDEHWVPQVSRGIHGTRALAHDSGEPVLIGGSATFRLSRNSTNNPANKGYSPNPELGMGEMSYAEYRESRDKATK